MKSYHDGTRWNHRFRQSWLKDADLCAERARLGAVEELPRVETDAASVGTAVHAAIEYELTESTDSLQECLHVFHHEFDVLVAEAGDDFKWAKYTPTQAHAFGELCFTNWYEQVLPTLERGANLEHEFCVTLVDTPDRLIELTGTIDWYKLFPDNGIPLRDWKTSGRPYQPWEKKRWDLQSAVYSFAMFGVRWDGSATATVPFEFVVMHPKGVQRITVERGWADWNWLGTKCEALAGLIEADLPQWQVNDNHALCSPVWCPAWGSCRGKSLGPDPWNQLEAA